MHGNNNTNNSSSYTVWIITPVHCFMVAGSSYKLPKLYNTGIDYIAPFLLAG